jgi:hypothetical protein
MKKQSYLQYHKEYMKKRFKEITDWKGMILMFVIFLGVLAFCAFTSAVPPVQSTIVAPQGLEIEATNFEWLTQNTYHNFRFRVYNVTNNVYMNDTHVNCSMGILDDKGEYVFQQPTVTASDYIFSVNVSAANFSRLGIYHQGINCITNDGTTAGGVKTLSFEVTPTGVSLTLGFYIILLILSLGIIILGYSVEDPWVIVLGSFGLVLFGLFMLLYGIDGFKDSYYTYGFAIITMMLGAYFGIKGALENVN